VSDDEGDEVSTGSTGRTDAHDDSGLELARLIARSLAGAKGSRQARPAGGKSRRRRRTDAQVSGAHPDDRDPQLLDLTVGRLVSDHGWETDLAVHGVFGRWPEIVGDEVAAHCLPESFTEGKLVVRTDSTAWATQLTLLAGTVVRRLNEELGDGTVRVIDVLGPHGPSWTRGKFTVKGRGPRDTYG
jgi:predicted nucleic acid-binding Zn ribbon protein